MAEDDVLIEIVDRENSPENHTNSVDYQPFGVKVLKLRVKRNPERQPELGPIWIHPEGYRRPEGAAAEPTRWRVYGTADDDDDLWVAWGAGDEKGFCAKTDDPWGFSKKPANLDDDEDYYVFLHLIHRPADPTAHVPTEKTLTIVATSENKDGQQLQGPDKKPQLFGRLVVKLTVPEEASNPARPLWRWDDAGKESIIALGGADGQPTQIPKYVSRWWPARHVEYETVAGETSAFLESLEIRYQRQVDGQDESSLAVFHDGALLAQIEGDIRLPLHDYRLFTVEVFRFVDDYQLVLRLWFYWVDLNFSEEQLMQFTPAENQAAWRAEAQRVRQSLQGGMAAKPWRKREEVPDVERFDLILPPDKKHIKHVGTDIHWQEYWSRITQTKPLRGRIATATDIPELLRQGKEVTELTPMRRAKLGKLLAYVQRVSKKIVAREGEEAAPERPRVFDPLANGLCDYANEHTGHACPHRPTDGELVPTNIIDEGEMFEMCNRCGTHVAGEGAKAVGALWGKHAPKLDRETTKVLKGAVSTNVLHG